MKNYFLDDLGLQVRTAKGLEVPLPDNNILATFARYPISGLLEIRQDGIQRKGLRQQTNSI